MIGEHSSFPKHCEWKQNLAVWSQNRWQYYNVDYIDKLPLSTQSIINHGQQVANTRDALTELTVFDVDEHQLLQLRLNVLDDIEVRVWVTRSQGLFTTRGVHTEVSLMSRAFDPYLAMTEFNILGRDRNAFLEPINQGDYTYAQGRVVLWGYRYLLRPLQNVVERPDPSGVIRPFIMDPRNSDNLLPLHTAYTSAEGRQS